MFYRRLSPFRIFQIGVWVTTFICVGSSLGIGFALALACRPLAASWDPTLAGTAQCLNRPAIYVATAALGIGTDFMLLALPISTVVSLNIKKRQKVALICLFVVGSMYVMLFTVTLPLRTCTSRSN